jgi:hypothetical protein
MAYNILYVIVLLLPYAVSRLPGANVPLKIYVRCQVSRGFFGSEFYVVVGDSSAFVDQSSVKVDKAPDTGKEVEGKVLAYLVKEESERALVELPGQAVVGGLRTWVPRSMFASA